MTDRPIYFKNSEAETIPPFACMAIVSASYEERDLIVTVRKPTSGDVASGAFVFNGPVECPEDGGGLAYADPYLPALISGTPSVGEVVGPVAGQWYLSNAGIGYVVWAEDPEPSTNIYLVQKSTKSVVCYTPGGGIAARSGSTVSSAACSVVSRSGSTISTGSNTIVVYNMSTTAVAGSAYIVAEQTSIGFVAVWEDC